MRSGVGLRAPDNWTVPLCFGCHSEFHDRPWPGAAEEQYRWLAETLAAWVDEFAETAPRDFARAADRLAALADR